MLSIKQGDLIINQYFTKVKFLCREISQLDQTSHIEEPRMKRIIIHGLRPTYIGFIAAIQGWPTQPSLVEFENLLAGQEILAKQMRGVSTKSEEEVLFSGKGKDKPKQNTGKGLRRNDDRSGSHQGSSQSGVAQWHDNKNSQSNQRKKFNGNCGKKGHMAKDC